MALVRSLVPMVVVSLVWATSLAAQETGTITGQVVDATTQQPLAAVNIGIRGTPRATVSGADGGFVLGRVPAGVHELRATRIGYGSLVQEVTVTAGGAATVQVALQPQAALIEPVVVTGYGTQRREAITGSVASISADAANVGVVTNVDQLIQGRAAGVVVTPNNGEPGGGVQIRIRGGASISASNNPLYVIDGVPIQNVPGEAQGFDIGGRGEPASARNPLSLLNPADIASITILKDAAAAAIYGSRASNGVVLIETKRGAAGGGGPTIEYDGYVGVASPRGQLDVLTGAQYSQFVQGQVAIWRADSVACTTRPSCSVADSAGKFGGLNSSQLATLGSANTDWEREVTRTAVTHNHNVSLIGGSEATRYRGSLNYMDQKGVVLSNGFERIQGRLNATHRALDERLRLGLNVTASHARNDYILYENTGGFEGGIFHNVAVFNPTRPVRVANPVSGEPEFFETGPGRQETRNPVAMAEEVLDFGTTTRTLSNASAELDLFGGLTAQVNVGADVTNGTRRAYLPNASPVGAEFKGRAQQADLDNSAVTLQTLFTFRRQLGDVHGLDIVGGYEFSEYTTTGFWARARDFLIDALGYNNLDGANVQEADSSTRRQSRLVSFFGRANYNLRDRYYLTGVLRRDGSSVFPAGNKWAVFPAISGSWRISEEDFWNRPLGLTELRLRAGWGLQGNQAVPPYSSLPLVVPSSSAGYPFGDQPTTGVAQLQNPNADLKWEQTSQFNVALDFAFLDNRISGIVEYYIKTTKDLLLEVPVPQPASVETRIENIGRLRNRGLEVSLDALPVSRPGLTWRAGLVFTAERNKVLDLGGRTAIATGDVSGQGQSGQRSQRIMPGHPLSTFFGPEFVGVNASGQQLFNDYDSSGRIIGQTTSPTADDFQVLGDANPDFTFGLTSQVSWGKFDASFLIRSEVGQKVFNNTALVYGTKGNAKQGKNFLASALDDPTGINEPAIFSSRWVEGGSFLRVQNVTLGYTFTLPGLTGGARSARLYVSGDNLLLLSGYSGPDPEVHTEAALRLSVPGGGLRYTSRGTDYLTYPRPRTITTGIRVAF